MSRVKTIPSISVNYAQTGASTKSNELGMRAMQERAYEKRGEQYLLIKSPPASGKSRALMFIALDKLRNQGIKKAIVVVPEKSIGSSFSDEPLSQFGFWADWEVPAKWNLCNAPTSDQGKVRSVGEFLNGADQILVCTHATFRFAVDQYGSESFDDCLLAVDEFHHISQDPNNKLGAHLAEFIARDKAHVVAMTGSYFRGDAVPVLSPEDESKFETVTYTYYEQLNGYDYLKSLDIGYYFYSGAYSDEIMSVLDPNEKTILHIPNVNARESTKDKYREVEHIIDELGEWLGEDADTGFQLVKIKSGRTLRIADLVNDDAAKRDKVSASLKDSAEKNNRDHVDIIIALGMAKEGFDWIWCEHALTVGYRASLTEVVQIIGRATRDAVGKTRARFTNLIAEPDASEQMVAEAINDTLKAIAASLLMEQVLAPRFNFKPKNATNGPQEGFDYGESGYKEDECNIGYNNKTGEMQIEIKGLAVPKSEEAKRICKEDINEVITAVVQDKQSVERGMFDDELVSEEITQVRIGKIVNEKYPELDAEDQEAVRQHAVAALNVTQQAKKVLIEAGGNNVSSSSSEEQEKLNTALIDGVRKFAMDVRELDVDLIDRINPFSEAYAIMAKTMSESRLKEIATVIAAKKVNLSMDDARDLAKRALKFKAERGRLPNITSPDPWEKRMAEGVAFLAKKKRNQKMPKPQKKFTEEDSALLNELGVEVEVKKAAKYSKEEERIIAGFEEILRFAKENGRAPQHGEDKDIFERLYAVRLDRLNELPACQELLLPMDHDGLLCFEGRGDSGQLEAGMDDDELLKALGVDAEASSIQELKHVRPSKEIRAAEEVASRKKCEDFEQYKKLFDQVKEDLKANTRQMIRCNNKADVKIGDLLVLQGQTAYIANAGESFIDGEGREDCRLRVIYSNGTESDMLRRSFQKRLWEDDTARRIATPSDMGPLFSDRVCEEDQASGVIYVLRSKSEQPYIAKNRELIHKIGFTNGNVEKRIADAANQPTYLLAEVEVVASYSLYNLNANKLENLFHKFFSPARLDIEIEDRFGKPFQPREWFLVPLDAIKEAVEKLIEGTIGDYKYDPEKATLVKI